ncbi:MAG: hypothetical protein DHS20C02_19730 [Micavibrio sp.]|nr:MAG: hypothetical protein DHS20C02_19730 [Micavibrio sp.]
MKHTSLLLVLSLLVLTGCVTREQADTRIARGCAAGVEIFLDEGFKIKEIKDTFFKDSSEFGSGYRNVIIKAVESDDWLDVEKQYECVFAESFGVFNANHRATIYQLKVNDQVYGNEGGKIKGNFKDHLKLTEIVEQAMNR